ncbi:MAG TPA: glycosyltransferase [Isosphaeraceae bacterium]|jgi:glycosyltransferase involved in cell wall biosynthesis
MPPRIAYWTSAFEADIEAIASEVSALRRCYPGSVAWGLSHRCWALLSWRRGYCLNPWLSPVFCAATRILEPLFQLNHIFGSLGDWYYLRGTRRRPTVLTMAALSPPVDSSLLDRVDRFVVEYPSAESILTELGIGRERIRLIFPPVDLRRFTPSEAPEAPFTVVFASSAHDASWVEARGLPQLLDAAALRPEMRFRLIWRPWGDSLELVRRWVAQRGLTNVEIVVGKFADMEQHYRTAHATAVPFARIEKCKPAPNSLVESLACGRPVIVTPEVGLAEMVREAHAGIVCACDGESLAEGFDRVRSDWHSYSAPARRLSERWFSAETFLSKYHAIYTELIQ